MNRKEMYEVIKNNGYKEEIKNTFGKNYTLVGNEALEEFINKKKNANKVCEKKKNTNIKNNNTSEFIDVKARECIKSIATVLNMKKVLDILD